jgi:hypothetical protein
MPLCCKCAHKAAFVDRYVLTKFVTGLLHNNFTSKPADDRCQQTKLKERGIGWESGYRDWEITLFYSVISRTSFSFITVPSFFETITGLDYLGSRVRLLAGTGNFSLHHRVQNGSWAHPALVQWVSGASSLWVKWSMREDDYSPPSSAEVKEWVQPYLHSPIRLHGVVLS